MMYPYFFKEGVILETTIKMHCIVKYCYVIYSYLKFLHQSIRVGLLTMQVIEAGPLRRPPVKTYANKQSLFEAK